MQKGRTIVEMLGVLVILGVATMGAIALWSQMRTKMRISATQNELSQISQDINKLYSWTRDYSLLSMDQICDSKVFPKGCNESNEGINPFGGIYDVPEIGKIDGIPYFKLMATGLPDEDICHEIMDVFQEDYTCTEDTLTVTFY